MIATFILPLPPSLNNAFNNVAGIGRVKTSEYKSWRNAAAWQIKAQRQPTIEGDVVAHLTIQRPNKSSDLDNRLKAIFDAAQTAGIIKNDNQIVEIHARWGNVKGAHVIMANVEVSS